MSTALATRPEQTDTPGYMEKLLNGDLSVLTPDERTHYYLERCRRLGLDPMSQPFLFMETRARDGEKPKTILYATRGATDQIAKRDGLSGVILSKEITGQTAIVVVRISGEGRSVENIGAAGFKYDNQAGDALKRAATQAYRRGIIQYSGLGMVSEEDIVDIAGGHDLGLHDVVLPAAVPMAALPAKPAQDETSRQAPKKWRETLGDLVILLKNTTGEVVEIPASLTMAAARALKADLEARLNAAADSAMPPVTPGPVASDPSLLSPAAQFAMQARNTPQVADDDLEMVL